MSDSTTNALRYLLSPATGSTVPNLFRVLAASRGGGISYRYALKMPLSLAVAMIFSPFNLYEKLRYGPRIRNMRLREAPVYIIGHWRSGTTHLHNLMSQDPQFGFTTTRQCTFPASFLSNPLLPVFLRLAMPEKRPMDNMKLRQQAPNEDELAMANLSPLSLYNAWFFPRSTWENYRKFVRFKGVSKREVRRWQHKYRRMLRKAAIEHEGRRLVLKNPAHTARIPVLLNLYPDAKFVFLHRDPFRVFASTRKLYARAVPQFALHDLSREESDEIILRIYEDVQRRYLETRDLIPAGNLIEVPFDDLEADRSGVLARIYARLRLPGWETARPQVERYLASLKHYRKNPFRMSDEDRALVRRRWAFAFDAWGYAKD